MQANETRQHVIGEIGFNLGTDRDASTAIYEATRKRLKRNGIKAPTPAQIGDEVSQTYTDMPRD